jgi:hypothetical protein
MMDGMTMTTKYVVINENALCYINDVQPEAVGILTANVTCGGPSPIDGPVFLSIHDVVCPATARDLAVYRVMLPGNNKVSSSCGVNLCVSRGHSEAKKKWNHHGPRKNRWWVLKCSQNARRMTLYYPG